MVLYNYRREQKKGKKKMFKNLKRKYNEQRLVAKAAEAYEAIIIRGEKYSIVNRYSLLIEAKDDLKYGYISQEFYNIFTEKVKNTLPK